MRWPVIIALAAGGALLLAGTGASANQGPITKEERQRYRKLAREVSEEIEQRYGIDGLADYLDAVAYWESKWNPSVAGDGGQSIGLYQMQAGTAFRKTNGLEDLRPQAPRILRDPVKATILAADYAVQGARRARSQGGRGDWFAVRRWWLLPAAVDDDYGNEYPKAFDRVKRNFTKALKAVGLPVSFMNNRPDVSGYPGIQQVLDDLNVNLQGASA